GPFRRQAQQRSLPSHHYRRKECQRSPRAASRDQQQHEPGDHSCPYRGPPLHTFRRCWIQRLISLKTSNHSPPTPSCSYFLIFPPLNLSILMRNSHGGKTRLEPFGGIRVNSWS